MKLHLPLQVDPNDVLFVQNPTGLYQPICCTISTVHHGGTRDEVQRRAVCARPIPQHRISRLPPLPSLQSPPLSSIAANLTSVLLLLRWRVLHRQQGQALFDIPVDPPWPDGVLFERKQVVFLL